VCRAVGQKGRQTETKKKDCCWRTLPWCWLLFLLAQKEMDGSSRGPQVDRPTKSNIHLHVGGGVSSFDVIDSRGRGRIKTYSNEPRSARSQPRWMTKYPGGVGVIEPIAGILTLGCRRGHAHNNSQLTSPWLDASMVEATIERVQ
jgi:hypothetical protein